MILEKMKEGISMGKYHELAKEIVKNVGGKENILDFNRIIDPLQCVIDQLVKQYYKKKR